VPPRADCRGGVPVPPVGHPSRGTSGRGVHESGWLRLCPSGRGSRERLGPGLSRRVRRRPTVGPSGRVTRVTMTPGPVRLPRQTRNLKPA
jgi:hypothetical protein